MPKKLDPKVKLRIANLLGDGKSASDIPDIIAAEFPGVSVSRHTVGNLAKALNIELPRGRPKDVHTPRAQSSPFRAPARRLSAQGLGPTEIAAKLGISKQAVSYLLTDEE